MIRVFSCVLNNVMKHKLFMKKHEGPRNEMTLAERHRFLRHFVVQDRGASNRVTHQNKNVIINIFTSFLYLS